MLKYVDTRVCFAEIPDEITLAINISGCPCHCKGCHSAYLAEDIGRPLTVAALRLLLLNNKGITCISFMGGDSDPKWVNGLAKWVKRNEFRNVKVAWYSGRQELSKEIDINNFDFIKLGPYQEENGPLNSPNTNQKFLKVVNGELIDITYKFWKHEIKDKSKENK